MSVGKHSGIIVGKGFSAFIDGIPNDHQCNSDGDTVYETKSGKRITWNTHREWASMTTMARQPLIFAYYDSIGDPILGASVSCSICKSVAIDQAVWM